MDIFSRKGFRFKGTASIHSEGKIFEDVISHYRKAGSRHSIRHIVFIKVERALPIFSPAYDLGLSEEEIRNRWIEYWNSTNEKPGKPQLAE